MLTFDAAVSHQSDGGFFTEFSDFDNVESDFLDSVSLMRNIRFHHVTRKPSEIPSKSRI